MNKRIKKKRELENRLKKAEQAVEYLLCQNNQLWYIVDEMKEINSQNTEATNNRFDQIEAEVKALKKTQKKSWFSRK
ncbi:hypothetical protein STRDD10_01958 [Streptococcus sp. DD10]|uniref:hypothetical protein n=1 Tax=Streptococcus sp. DD10 TaxID=1777878 RepID=UPI000799CA0B|nr:hypothetical protein [Streptococcus sp. DD10]KXT72387.1 hypothetical protein STRDD10_01958 [Streptococcus sp. DD10]